MLQLKLTITFGPTLSLHIFLCCNTEDFKVPAHLSLVIKCRSRANCEIAALQRALASRTLRRGLQEAGPCIPKFVPFRLPAPMQKLILPSQVLLFGPTRPSRPWYGTMQGTRWATHTMRGSLPVPAPVVAWAPLCKRCVSERESECLRPISSHHEERAPLAMLAPSFLLGTRAADVHASRTPWPSVVDLRSGLSFLFWVAWAPLLSLPLILRMGNCQIRIITNRHL